MSGPIRKGSGWWDDFLNALFLRPVYREPAKPKPTTPRPPAEQEAND